MADVFDEVEMPQILVDLFAFLALPCPSPIRAMRLEFQIAQKLHGASAPRSKRAHDLIDLQLIVNTAKIDLAMTAGLCRQLFKYRKVHEWPPCIEKGEDWDKTYDEQMSGLPVLASVDDAIGWANELIDKIDRA